jgi:hypothetical protein
MTRDDWWNEATRALTPGEIKELERLLTARRKREGAPKAAASSPMAPAPVPKNGMQQYVSSTPGDALADFRDRSNGVPEPKCWVDGI